MTLQFKALLLTLCFFLSAMAQGSSQDDKLKIVASASMFSDMISNLVPENVSIETIVPIGGDPHKYRARPSDARKVQAADLIIVNGLTFEGWINELIKNSGTKAQVVTITEGVDAIESLQYANSSDPHAWMDISNVYVYVSNMRKALVQLLPQQMDVINENAKVYLGKLKTLHEEIKAEIATIPEKQRVLITSHDAFQYFGQQYGLKLDAIMGISTEAEAQTSDILRVSKSIEANNVPAVFIESTINPKMLQQIASDNDVAIGGELFADSLGDEKSQASTYLDMMRYNTRTIVAGLTMKRPAKEKVQKKEKNEIPNLMDGMSKPLKILLGLVLLAAVVMVFASKLKKK